jgi:N utilization substance protein A
MEVLVEDRQLSLAIGKKGQNVRLAAKLTGWKIDIKSDEDKKKEVEAQLAGIDFGSAGEAAAPLVLPEIHDEVVSQLRSAGYDTIDKILEAGAGKLAELPGFDGDTIEAVLAAAQSEKAAQVAAAESTTTDEGAAESEGAPVEANADAPASKETN